MIIEESDNDEPYPSQDDSAHDGEFEFDQDLLVSTSKTPPVKGGSTKATTASSTKKKNESKTKGGPPIKPNKSIPFYSTDKATPGVLNGRKSNKF